MEQEIINMVLEQGPFAVALALGYFLFFRLYWNERSENRELQDYIRKTDRENVKLLQEFSTLLKNIINISNTNKDSILDHMKTEAKEIKTHVDLRVKDLENKITR